MQAVPLRWLWHELQWGVSRRARLELAQKMAVRLCVCGFFSFGLAFSALVREGFAVRYGRGRGRQKQRQVQRQLFLM